MQLLFGCVAVLACAAIAWLTRRHSRDARRLRAELLAMAVRLEPSQSEPAGGDALAYLSRAATGAVDRSLEALGLARSLGGALEALPLGVVVTAPDGRVLFRNESADELLGTRASDALAWRALSDLLAEAAAGQAGSRPLDLYGPPRRTLSLTAVPLENGAAAVTVEDVSDRKRLDAVRRDFVANVSHELKTPVAALGLLAETLAAEDDAAVVQRLAERMQDEAFRVARIIDDLLDLSRLEAEETTRNETVRVHEVLTQAVEQVLPSAGLRRVRLAVTNPPKTWTVRGDRRQLVSAMSNLMENAVKYSDEGSTVEVSPVTDGRDIELVVRDHGIGIPSRDLDRIFERFYRVDRGRGRDTGGTGLGLSIVRHIASNHGGEVAVESVEGEGSTFTLRLPAEPGPVGVVADAG
ncbi:MAG: sensor histidine kinase [Acidimicrobiales bacterium]